MSSPASHVLVQEHGDIDDGEMHRLVAAIGNQGCSPIVRIPAPENFIVKRALDTGGEPTHHLAGGERSSTLLPPSFSSWPSMPHDVDRGKPMSPTEHRKAALDDVSQADARKFVSYCRFPSPRDTRPTAESIAASPYSPLNGVRGAGSPYAPVLFKQSMGDYLANANKQIFLAVQIETEEGLENCEEIAKVDGIGEWVFLCAGFGERYSTCSYSDSFVLRRYALCRSQRPVQLIGSPSSEPPQ
jgi:4-hydroxy-2-oxoheptanedioate aldolase